MRRYSIFRDSCDDVCMMNINSSIMSPSVSLARTNELHALDGRHFCIMISSLGAGGAERVIALLSRHWIAMGVRVTILSFDDEDAPIYHDFDAGVQFRRLGSGRPGIGRAIHRIGTIRRILRRERPDLLVSFLTKINFLALVASVGTHIPVVVAERNNPQRQQAHIGWRMGLALLYPRAARIICQTQASLRCLPRGVASSAKVIPNPIVPLAMRSGRAKSVRQLVAVGRLTHQKGFDILIDAFARVAGKHREWSLDIWGEGPDAAALLAQIARLGMEQRITLRGLSALPGGWIVEADAFVLPSRYEGFPNVLGEALAAGLPALAADCAFGPADLVTHGENGLLVNAEDVDALADGIDLLLGDAGLRERLGMAAAGVRDRFSAAKIATLWDAAVGPLLSRT